MVVRVRIRSFSSGFFSSPELLYFFLQNAGKDIVEKKHNKVVPEDHLCIAQMVCTCTTNPVLWEMLNLLCPGFTADSNMHHKLLWHFREVLDSFADSLQLICADAVEMSGVSGHWVTWGCYCIVLPAGPLDSQKSHIKVKKVLRFSLPSRQNLWAEEGMSN